MKRSNFPGNQQTKLQGAISRLEARIKLPHGELVKTAKRFRGISAETVTQMMPSYIEDMNAQLAHLKALVK